MAWEPVTVGRSGAVVLRGPGAYRKESTDPAVDLREEARRLEWLRAQGLPAPEVLESGPGVLVTREVPGRTAADPWPEQDRARVVDALARVARDLHALPVDACPFDRRLDVALAAALVAEPDLDDLDPERAGWDRDRLVAELLATRPASEDLVVCHGDLTLPNVVLDPDTLEVTGLLDAGRLGVTDRWSDLALTTRSLASPRKPHFGEASARHFLAAYGVEPDAGRIAFYRLLDEFF